MTSFLLPAGDGVNLHLFRWEPASSTRAIVQIVHGLAEHAGRYAELAGALNAAGYAVYANDHRGHGHTASRPADLGFFSERGGWRKCHDDLLLVRRRIEADHPGIPVIMLGHSMGSFLAQQFMSEQGATLAGVVLSASDGRPSVLALVGRLVARIERLRLGGRGRSALIHALAFDAFNKAFEPARTSADWLSRDREEVDRYLADPLCGFVATVQLWIDLLDGLGDIATPARLTAVPRELPIHLITGTRDAVSAHARGVERLIAIYRQAGLEHVTGHFYPDARHELFHEINRLEVMRDLIAWLDTIVETPRAGQV